MEKMPPELIVTGDFNSKSPLWGEEIEDKHGELFGDMTATMGLIVMNWRKEPTFVRGESKSIIGLTMTTSGLETKVEGWTTLEDGAMIPHQPIIFKIRENIKYRREEWRRDQVDKEKLGAELQQVAAKENIKTAEEMMNIIESAYIKTIPEIRTKNGKLPYLWSNEIGELRKAVCRSRRKATRSGRGQNENDKVRLKAEYRYLRK